MHPLDPYRSRVDPEPSWQKRLDPVLYRSDVQNAPVGPALLEGYERDGYLIVPNLFSPEEVSVFLGELDRVRADPAVVASEKTIREPGSNAVRSVFEIHRDNALFARVARDERIAAVASFILGGDVYIHQSRMNFKPGLQGKEFYWHSDFETWHIEDGMPRMRALSCSILLTDNHASNGPLMLMPGSHRHYVRCVGETPEDHYRESLRKQQYGVPDDGSLKELADRCGIAMATGGAGTVVFFDCNIMHGSNSNITPWARSNLFYVYNHVDNRLQDPPCGLAPRPFFIAERNDFSPLDIRAERYSDV